MSAALDRDPGGAPRLLDELLAEQARLSAVESFARRHDGGALGAEARVYEDRIPLGRAPRPGQQLAFRVDLDRCTGCKACVTACHSLNGLAPDETWRDVGLLVGEGCGSGLQQTVTTACHHCEDPACLAGCPVRAYEKDPVTGIVRHLDDQCIGCKYCMLKCPYDVPRYSSALGIVRKCDMCAERLAGGEAPACVQGCPNAAISIEIVDRAGAGSARDLLPGAAGTIPDSAYTRPTTRYVSKRPVAALRPADWGRLAPAPAHDPLAVMLVGMQLSVGVVLFDAVAVGLGLASAAAQPFRLALAAGSALLGLAAATLHLGRPRYAFRAFLGWRTSWMSREILVFGAYVPAILLATAAAGVAHGGWGTGWLPPGLARAVLPGLPLASLGLGLAGTACSAMIYVDTHRPAWALGRTGPTFGGTLLGLGALGAGAATALGASAGTPRGVAGLLAAGLLALLLKIALEARFLARRGGDPHAALERSARLLRGPLRSRVRARWGAALAGALGAALGLAAAWGSAPAFAAAGALAALLGFGVGELVERHLYFTAEASRGMPGH